MNDPVLFGENGLQQIYQHFLYACTFVCSVFKQNQRFVFITDCAATKHNNLSFSQSFRTCCITEPINWFFTDFMVANKLKEIVANHKCLTLVMYKTITLHSWADPLWMNIFDLLIFVVLLIKFWYTYER